MFCAKIINILIVLENLIGFSRTWPKDGFIKKTLHVILICSKILFSIVVYYLNFEANSKSISIMLVQSSAMLTHFFIARQCLKYSKKFIALINKLMMLETYFVSSTLFISYKRSLGRIVCIYFSYLTIFCFITIWYFANQAVPPFILVLIAYSVLAEFSLAVENITYGLLVTLISNYLNFLNHALKDVITHVEDIQDVPTNNNKDELYERTTSDIHRYAGVYELIEDCVYIMNHSFSSEMFAIFVLSCFSFVHMMNTYITLVISMNYVPKDQWGLAMIYNYVCGIILISTSGGEVEIQMEKIQQSLTKLHTVLLKDSASPVAFRRFVKDLSKMMTADPLALRLQFGIIVDRSLIKYFLFFVVSYIIVGLQLTGTV